MPLFSVDIESKDLWYCIPKVKNEKYAKHCTLDSMPLSKSSIYN